MSTNLTISYTSLTAPGLAPGGANATDTPAADSPLGFLAALIDQLLTGGVEPATTADANTDKGIPGLTGLPFGNAVEASPAAGPATPGLIADLTSQLDALRSQLATGNSPAPAQLQRLSDTIDALTTAIAAPTPAAAKPGPDATDAQLAQLLASLGAAATPTPGTVQPVADAREKLVALSQSFAATSPALSQKLEALAGRLADVEASPELLARLTGQPSDDTATISAIIRALLGEAPATDTPAPLDSRTTAATPIADELLQLLATLGLSAAPANSSAAAAAPTDATATTTAVSPALLRLSNQLSQLSSSLADAMPELAQKLDAVATKLVSVGADPQLLAQLTNAAAGPNGAALDKIVRSLLDPNPAASPTQSTPQIAAPDDLEIPAPLALQQSKSSVTEVKAAQPQTAPVMADSAPQPYEPTPRLTVTDPAAPATPQAQTGTSPIVPGATNRALPAAYQSVANPINMGQMAFEMVRQVQQGASRFTLRLDPPELGRVDVKMHVDQQGAVTARLTVERAETLDLFQRDQRSLERALAQAGLDSSKTTLEFSLRQNPFGGSGGDQRQQQPDFANAPRFSSGDNDNAAMPAATLYRGIASAGGVNIFA